MSKSDRRLSLATKEFMEALKFLSGVKDSKAQRAIDKRMNAVRAELDLAFYVGEKNYSIMHKGFIFLVRGLNLPDPSGNQRRNALVEYVLYCFMKPDDVETKMLDLEEIEDILNAKFTHRWAKANMAWQKTLVVCGALVDFIRHKTPGYKTLMAVLSRNGDDK